MKRIANSMKKTRKIFVQNARNWTAALLAIGSLSVCSVGMLALTPSRTAWAATRTDDGEASVETATKSKIAPITLPEGAFRSKAKDDIAKFAQVLDKLARENNRQTGDVEVLVWPTKKDVKASLSRILKEAGYGYAAQPPMDNDGDKITMFAAMTKEKSGLFGMWVDHENNQLLAWTTISAKGGKAEPAAHADEETDAPTPKRHTKRVVKLAPEERKRLNAELSKAVSDGSLDDVKSLLAKGADPDGEDAVGNPLVVRATIWAASNKSEGAEKLTALLEAGANPDKLTGDDDFALKMAAITDKPEVIDLLLDGGADVNRASEKGMTALHFAAVLGKSSATRHLIERGADVSLKNKQGQTPLEIARRLKQEETAALIADADSIRSEAKPAHKPTHKSSQAAGDDSGDILPEPAATQTEEEAPAPPKRHEKAEAESASTANAINLRVDASTESVNVMGRKMSALPTFPNLAVKPKIVRGYVRDLKGHPLKGAVIGVRSTSAGGFYSGASAKTDASGYYEVEAPWGAAHFYCAGYQADYGDLIAAFGLHPADGDDDGFATQPGLVKNWVLLPYGVGDREKAQEQPHYSGSYYGGTIVFGYNTDSDLGSSLPANSEIEITLTPTGPCIDGSKAPTITVHKAIASTLLGSFYLNNIPVAPYKIKVRLAGGGTLHMKETGPYSRELFGMTPKDATGEAELLLKVQEAKPHMVLASHGNWQEFQISLTR